MVISNDAALKLFKTNMDRFYVQYTDLMSHVQYGDTEQVYFAQNEEVFSRDEWVAVTVNEDDVLIEVEGSVHSFEEAITYAKTKGRPILLRLDEDTAVLLEKTYALCLKDQSGYEHQGVFGGAVKQPALTETDVFIRRATAQDVARLAALPVAEWGNLPVIIRFAKNYDQILLAEYDGEIAGYLTYASSYEGYSDVVHILTHSTKRGQGVGKALVGTFMEVAFAKGGVPYYGEAKTAASAALARSMGFEQLHPPKAVFEVMGIVNDQNADTDV